LPLQPFLPGGIILNPATVISQDAQPASFKIDLVKEFVIAGHGNLEKVKQMMAENPNLVYCSYDWGNGDFEQAIEGAGHVGNKEIARHLIDNGARPNIYVLTMLGETDLVKNMLNKFPQLLNSKGPHGLTLLHHASKGGEDAKELLEFFKEKGLTEMQVKIK
jgi:ankyrin repeat protein